MVDNLSCGGSGGIHLEYLLDNLCGSGIHLEFFLAVLSIAQAFTAVGFALKGILSQTTFYVTGKVF